MPFTENVSGLEVPPPEPPSAGFVTRIWTTPAAVRSPAFSATWTWVELPNVVVRGEPFRVTDESRTKPVPVRVTAADALPARIDDGDSAERAGNGFLTLTGRTKEVPPPGGGFTTAIWSVPALEISVERTFASKLVEFRKMVDRMLPLTVTADCATKLLPVTVSANVGPPVETVVGDREVICGKGLVTGLMVNVSGWVIPPPGGIV